jgi:hypothetical protein|tara:strand:- start:3446 stop:3790 length:345 start_codon:yes stop_codon:yes gene_type:complete
MNKPYKFLLGQRVAIAFPKEEDVKEVKPKSNILLTPELEKQKAEEDRANTISGTERFIIAQVGEGCNKEFLKEGDEVSIEQADRVLAPGQAETVIEDGKVLFLIVPERYITGVF